MLDIILIPLAVYLLMCVYAWFMSDRQIFLPPISSYPEHGDLLTIHTSDGEEIKAIHRENRDARLTILYSHGNAEDLGDLQADIQQLHDLGFSVLAYDYRGYGLSSGRPSTAGACLDVEAAYTYLIDTVGLEPEQIVLYGRSVGGGPSVHLAAHHPVGGLILQSAFTSAFVVVTRIALLPFDKFRNLALMPKVSCPVLVMHGKADRVIPFSHGLKLYKAAPEPKQHLWLKGTGHNRFPGDHEEKFLNALTSFRDLILLENTTHQP